MIERKNKINGICCHGVIFRIVEIMSAHPPLVQFKCRFSLAYIH